MNYIVKLLPNSIVLVNKNFSILIKENKLNFIVFFCKKHTNLTLNQLVDLTAVDFPNKKKRFTLYYVFSSTKTLYRLFIKVKNKGRIQSISEIYSSSVWLEREIWDLFGIFFKNHLNLRRILTDYGFNGFPLRKDFPLSGFYEVRYDDTKKMIVSEPIQLSQEFRNFSFKNFWKN